MSTTVSTVSLDYLEQQVRKRAKMTRSNFVTTDEVKELLRGSIRELYDLLVNSFEDYRILTLDESTVVLDDARQYILPQDFFKLRGVDFALSGTQWCTLKPIPWNERNSYINGSYGPMGYILLGRPYFNGVQQNYLQILPEVGAPTTSYRVFYTPKPTIPVNGADAIDGINGWEEYVIADVTGHVLDEASRDSSMEYARKNAMSQRIAVMSKKRDSGMAKQSALVSERGNNWPWSYRG